MVNFLKTESDKIAGDRIDWTKIKNIQCQTTSRTF